MMPEAIFERVRYRTLYPAAEAFVRTNGVMTESQMTGLRTLFASGQNVKLIQSYIGKRIERSRDAGRPDHQRYWSELDKKITEFRQRAASLLDTKEPSETDIHRLIEAFVVCLSAENRYRQKVARETQRTQESSDARRTDKPSLVQRGSRPRYGAPSRGRSSSDRGPKR
jgi:hypothetical protein